MVNIFTQKNSFFSTCTDCKYTLGSWVNIECWNMWRTVEVHLLFLIWIRKQKYLGQENQLPSLNKHFFKPGNKTKPRDGLGTYPCFSAKTYIGAGRRLLPVTNRRNLLRSSEKQKALSSVNMQLSSTHCCRNVGIFYGYQY